MSIRHGFCSVVMWAAVALTGLFSAPRCIEASQVTVSLGKLGFSWPQDAQALYSRLQQLANRVCESMDNIRLVTYTACRHWLARDPQSHPQAFDTTSGVSPRQLPRQQSQQRLR
jgi:UrcA family protein